MQNNKEAKKKIRELEAEIKEMQKDHAGIFGYQIKEEPSLFDLIMVVSGIISLSIGLIWMFSNFQTALDLAILKVGRLRLTPSICYLPLMIGILMTLFSAKKAVSAAVMGVGIIFAAFGIVFGINSSVSDTPISVCMVMLALTLAGAVLLVTAAARLTKKKKLNDE